MIVKREDCITLAEALATRGLKLSDLNNGHNLKPDTLVKKGNNSWLTNGAGSSRPGGLWVRCSGLALFGWNVVGSSNTYGDKAKPYFYECNSTIYVVVGSFGADVDCLALVVSA